MFTVVHTLHEDRIPQLMHLYRGEWWSRDRTEADVRRMLAETDIVIALIDSETDRLAGFARALSDGVYKAFLFDVIVDSAHRGTGLGKQLLDAVFAHPALQDVQHLELYCRPEHVAFYEKWGFGRAPAELCFLRCTRPSPFPAVPHRAT
jgi:GNAT superfamily N-acetyltransferase